MLTQDEAELYDRQIRLWGVNAQSRIRQSKVLMVGFNGVASEVAKILVLAGIDTLTIVDDQPLQDSDLTSNLFCRPSPNDDRSDRPYRTHAVQSKLKTLNPLVKINIDNSSVYLKTPDDYRDYDLVTVHSFLSGEEMRIINDICRIHKIKFYIVLDYGFFGFMFNDLGSEFKFTHEEFVNLANETARQSGAAKNPISVGDDGPEDPDDYGYGTSDDEDAKPKKRRRLHSPKREANVKVKDSEKQTVVSSLKYVTFQEMISLRTNAFNRQTSPVLLLSIAMFKFHNQYNHLPRCDDPQVRQEDLSKLNEIIISLKDTLNLHDHVFKKLTPDWSDHIYSSLSPVCAVLGGVAGQDMIRALSNKDIPINNTFSFDGISMTGIVERVGIEDSKTDVQPIVRDVLQIDDDE